MQTGAVSSPASAPPVPPYEPPCPDDPPIEAPPDPPIDVPPLPLWPEPPVPDEPPDPPVPVFTQTLDKHFNPSMQVLFGKQGPFSMPGSLATG